MSREAPEETTILIFKCIPIHIEYLVYYHILPSNLHCINDNKWKTVLEDNKFKPDAFSPSTQQQQN